MPHPTTEQGATAKRRRRRHRRRQRPRAPDDVRPGLQQRSAATGHVVVQADKDTVVVYLVFLACSGKNKTAKEKTSVTSYPCFDGSRTNHTGRYQSALVPHSIIVHNLDYHHDGTRNEKAKNSDKG